MDKVRKKLEEEELKKQEQEKEENDDCGDQLDRRQLMKRALQKRHNKSKDM